MCFMDRVLSHFRARDTVSVSVDIHFGHRPRHELYGVSDIPLTSRSEVQPRDCAIITNIHHVFQ